MKTGKQKFTASVSREERWYVAQCLEIDVASQGRSEKAALKNLADGIALHLTPPVATQTSKVRSVEVTSAV